MMKYKCISGQKFGRLTALYRLHNTKGRTKWLCVCECGNLVEVLSNSLLSNRTKSCGCLHNEISSIVGKRNTKHKKCNHRLYRVWSTIKDRCYNMNSKDYNNYGGRGIKMYDDWRNDFQVFYEWAMSNGYDDNLTIDRIDNNGNYEPNNCRWFTITQQNRNKRTCKYYTIGGETRCLSEWCEIYNVRYSKVWQRVKHGWSIEEALELEVLK